jgi:hypothetical protein
MVGEVRANGTIGMGCSILMIMERKSNYRDKKENKQESQKLLVHKSDIDNYLNLNFIKGKQSHHPFLINILKILV